MSIFGAVSAAGGFDKSEVDFITQLISSGQTTIDEVANQFGVPRDVVASAYAQNQPQNNESGLFNDLANIASSVGNLYGNTPSTPIVINNANSGAYQSPYALNAAENTAATNEQLANIAQRTNTVLESGSTALEGLKAYNAAETAAAASAASDVFAGGLGSVVGAVSGQESPEETVALTVLSAFNPAAALAYRLFDAMDLFGGSLLNETPMTAEEKADYQAQQKLDFVSNAANLSGEGGDALLSEAIAAAEARGISTDSLLSNLNEGYEDLTNTLRTDDGFVAGNAPVFTTGDAVVGESGEMANMAGSTARDYYEDFTPEQIAEMRAANAAVLDVPLNVAQGALMGTEMLTNVAGADNTVSQALGELQDTLGGMMSEQSKLDKQEISRIMSEAEGTGAWNEIKAAAEAFGVAPIDFVSNAIGTTIPVIAATAATGGGILPATAVGAATGVGTAKGAIYDATKQEMLDQGVSEEEANQIASEAQAYGGENLDEILISGAFGALAGSTGVEASVSRILQGLGKGGTATVIKGAAGESIGEFGEGGAEQYATNKALQELGLDVTDFQGVIGNATLESLAGAATGGGISAIETATEGGTEGIADTDVNLQIVKDFNTAYQNNLENLSGDVESLTTTGLENELTSNELGSTITGVEDTSGAATRDLNSDPKTINEVTESEISEIESAIEEAGLNQTVSSSSAQQTGSKVAALSSISNKAVGLFGAGAAAIAAVVYAANKSGASASEVAAATNLSVDQVNNLAAEAGQTINNQSDGITQIEGGTLVERGASQTTTGDSTLTLTSVEQVKAAEAAEAAANTAASSTTDTAAGTNTLSNVVSNANASTAINNAVTSSLSSGADITTSVNNSVSTSINNGVTTNTAVSSSVNSAVTTSVTSGANVSTVVDSAVTSAINSAANANGNVNSAINSAVNSAINSAANSGANVNAATNAAVNAAINAAVNAGVNVNTATNIANNAATNANSNVNSNVNTNVNPNVNANTNINANLNPNVNTNVNTNPNPNPNPNPNVNVNVNTNTNINQEVPDPERQKEGLMTLIQQTPLTESILFKPKFTEIDNVQLGMFERFLRAAGGRR